MKILMAVDDSPFSVDVLRAVVTQFRTENTEVRVLHVLQPIAPAPPQMAPGYAPELEDQKKPAHELVERIAQGAAVAQDSRWTRPSRWVTLEIRSSMPQPSGVPI